MDASLGNFKLNDIKKRMLQGVVGRVANNFMFTIHIPIIPALSEFAKTKGIMAGIPLTYVVRSTSIPQSERETQKIRLGRISNNVDVGSNKQFEYTIPKPSNTPHNWSVKTFLTEIGIEYTFLYEWYLSLDSSEYSLNELTTNATVTLYGINGNIIRTFKLIGIYPLNIPSIESLNYDSSDEFIELQYNFAYDHIYYDDIPIINNIK